MGYTQRWFLADSKPIYILPPSKNFIENYDGSRPGTCTRERLFPLTSVEILSKSVELIEGTEKVLILSFTPENATNKSVSYSSSNPAVASVSEDGIVTGMSAGTAEITVTTEDGKFSDKSTVTVIDAPKLFVDNFYLGIDEYVTGEVDASLSAKKAQLFVSGEVLTTGTVNRSGSYELAAEGRITKESDKVEVVVLDRKNSEVGRIEVPIIEKNYELTVNPYVLYEDTQVSGTTDYYHTHVAFMLNGEEVERKLLTATRTFTFDAEEHIAYEDDEVEVVGYRYDQEVSRKKVTIEEPQVEMNLETYTIDTLYVQGTVKGKSASSVRLYVNRKRQQTVNVLEDGSFKLLGVSIQSPTDKVEVAVLNDAGIEIQRFGVKVTN
ncbi:immunoglobulin-like domain-containing protein [Enterococcus sp. 9D6_DIV0238]|uniref:immunoglobulin-like domain-containing protein n=1 Tax=Enterococcus TaxID=1350 RepID=UPI0020CE4D33|nr:immunoglobulin-like domain-containing protein [Enterococcus sp. 9D6_DIV0238]